MQASCRDNNTFTGILKWSMDNISTIKDILWIIFTLIATVIAVLTYKRARYTILQPLRSEVIKKQTELLIDIMEAFSDDNQLLLDLDLYKIVTLNTYKILNQCGFVLNGAEMLQKECDKHLVGGLIVKRGGQLEMFEKPESIHLYGKNDAKAEIDFGSKFYESLKEGEFDIEIIYLTRKYYETMKRYQSLMNNAFLPKEMKTLLEKIIKNIYDDITINLKQLLEDFVCNVYEKRKNSEKFGINTVGIYNEFNEKRHDNSQLIAKVRARTREYLMIDKMW